MNKRFLIDGNSILFRSFHAIRDLRRSDGTPTNALYGYVMTLRNLVNDYSPSSMVVAFDRSEPTFRSELYPEYKANREAPPDELVQQIPMVKQATALMGFGLIEAAGYEADDLLGSMSVWLSARGEDSVIVTGDKDLMQLVNGSVSMLRFSPMKNQPNKMYRPEDVIERYGVEPERLLDVFALMGDSIDNIPGVKGIGEKTAIALIQEFGSLDSLYENLDKVSGKKRVENLINDKEKAFLSRELFKLKLDPPFDYDDALFAERAVDRPSAHAFFAEMEFRTFAQDYAEEKAYDAAEDMRYETVDTIEALNAMAQAIADAGVCAVDTETTSLDALGARMVGIAFSIERGQGWYVPFRHAEGRNLDLEEARPALKRILESDAVALYAHHFKYDLHILRNEGFEPKRIAGDTLIESYLVQPDRQSHKLDRLAELFAGMRMTPIADLIGDGKNQKSMTEVAISEASPYACEDVDACLRLHEHFAPQIKDCSMERLYHDVESPLVRVLNDMERQGILIDLDELSRQSAEIEQEIGELEEKIYASVGKRFNLNSPSQLAEILYDDLKLLSGRKKSTRADILDKLAAEGVEIAQAILDYRHRQKIKSTYLDALAKLIRPETGRVHTTFNQTVVNTGRISSSDPNLQNIPIRTELGRRVRRAFIARDGWKLAALDYSQIELRILAHVSKDPGLRGAFAQGEDIHRRTAAQIFGTALEDVSADQRRKAKEINFGLNYGMSPYGLARRIGVSDQEAADYIEAYFSQYPLVQRYMDETFAYANENLHVVTLLGRRVPTPGVRDANRMRRDNARRAAINGPIQGSAADMIKKAMVDVHREFESRDDVKLLLTVHDELVIEAKDDVINEAAQRCREIMEAALPLDVPAPVEWATGQNWADAK